MKAFIKIILFLKHINENNSHENNQIIVKCLDQKQTLFCLFTTKSMSSWLPNTVFSTLDVQASLAWLSPHSLGCSNTDLLLLLLPFC